MSCSENKSSKMPKGFLGKWDKTQPYRKGYTSYSRDYKILIKSMGENVIVVYENSPYEGHYIGNKLMFSNKAALYVNEKTGIPDKLVILGEAEYIRVK